MKQIIIETKNLDKEIPKYRTWFRLNDVIFVSVIHPKNSNRKSHFRRKSRPNTNQKKTDNDMCQWHSDWQFVKIESFYGTGINSDKTYEIVVNYEDEIHRIDSLVKNLAIEFQHTLTVSINEMESRFIAHNSLGYIPYLILDFTEFSAENTILRILRFDYRKIDEYIRLYFLNETINKFLKQIKKWLTSSYFNSNNLFCDFSDYIVRLVPKGVTTFYKYEQTFFLPNLLQLESILKEVEENEKKQIAEKKEEEKRKLQFQMKQERENKIANNNKQIIESQDYNYYRKCISNKYIKEAISNTMEKPEYVSFILKQREHFGYHRKIHIYRLYRAIEQKPLLEIQYMVIGEFKENKYSFLQSTIDVIKEIGENSTGIRRMTLRQKPQQPIKMISIRNEVAKGYLHSFDDYALYLYDENEKIIQKEYYIFNQKVSKSIHSELSDHFTSFEGVEVKSNNAKKILDKIKTEDKYRQNFIEYVMQNNLPEEILKEYYSDIDEPVPLEDNYDK